MNGTFMVFRVYAKNRLQDFQYISVRKDTPGNFFKSDCIMDVGVDTYPKKKSASYPLVAKVEK